MECKISAGADLDLLDGLRCWGDSVWQEENKINWSYHKTNLYFSSLYIYILIIFLKWLKFQKTGLWNLYLLYFLLMLDGWIVLYLSWKSVSGVRNGNFWSAMRDKKGFFNLLLNWLWYSALLPNSPALLSRHSPSAFISSSIPIWLQSLASKRRQTNKIRQEKTTKRTCLKFGHAKILIDQTVECWWSLSSSESSLRLVHPPLTMRGVVCVSYV